MATESKDHNLRARDSAMVMESEEYFNCTLLRQREKLSTSQKDIEIRPAPLSSPTSANSAGHMVRQRSLESELRILNVELARCQMTRDALARREAALLELKAEVDEEMKLKADIKAEERQRQYEEEEQEDVAEMLFMRNVQKRVEDGLKKAGPRTSDATRAEHHIRDKGEEKLKATKAIPISAPERRRLARMALLHRDPRLAH